MFFALPTVQRVSGDKFERFVKDLLDTYFFLCVPMQLFSRWFFRCSAYSHIFFVAWFFADQALATFLAPAETDLAGSLLALYFSLPSSSHVCSGNWLSSLTEQLFIGT